jgi:hypothetical protein
MESNLRVFQSFQANNSLGINERDELSLLVQQPKDEVGIEVTGLEESDTFTSR